MTGRPLDEWDPEFRETFELVYAETEEALRRLARL